MTLGSLIFLFWRVDLTPKVDPNFFFSSTDPQLAVEKKISGMFSESTPIIFSAKGDIHSEEYLGRMKKLTEELEKLPGVLSVHSLTQGPQSVKDAMESPLWSRILIAEKGKASNLFIFLEGSPDGIIERLEEIERRYDAADFRLVVSGPIYVSELIKRYLARDLRVFSLVAFLIFGAAIFVLFRSVQMVIGTVIACALSSSLTLILCHLFGIRIGLLTANLATILFVIVLSYIIFLNFDWRYAAAHRLPRETDWQVIRKALRMTFEGTFWSALTTFLGFASLMFFGAVPLQSLGISGAVGTAIIFSAVFLVYPWFLPYSKKAQSSTAPERVADKPAGKRKAEFSTGKTKVVALGLGFFCLFASWGMRHIDSDPSLLSYFSPKTSLYEKVAYVDRNLGSSPLNVVVKDSSGMKFNTKEAYQKLWNLHAALERDPEVGSVVSLPLIMAEAKRKPVISILPWEWLLELMEMTSFREIARRFVTEDRERGSFLLLMKESVPRADSRLETVGRIKGIVRAEKFEPDLVGGVYLLQGKLSKLVVASSSWGLTLLILLFVGMGWGLLHSWRVAGSVLVCLVMIATSMMGIMGHLRIPFDVISSPASNVAIGMGVDAMMRMICHVRKNSRRKTDLYGSWSEACAHLWRPILYSGLIICIGFGIFGFSSFPPTQRFGLSIVIGTVIEVLVTLFIFPILAAGPGPVLQETRSPQKAKPKWFRIASLEGARFKQ